MQNRTKQMVWECQRVIINLNQRKMFINQAKYPKDEDKVEGEKWSEEEKENLPTKHRCMALLTLNALFEYQQNRH